METNVIHQGNPVNDASPKEVRTRSRFNLNHKIFGTLRFGDLTPFLALESVEKDKIEARTGHQIRSYTLESPQLENVNLKKDIFVVPREAILPMQWERIYANPTIGDDVPEDANTVITVRALRDFCATLGSSLDSVIGAANWPAFIRHSFRFFAFAEMFFSRGSLLASLGCDLSPCVHMKHTSDISTALVDERYSIDKAFDAFVNRLVVALDRFDVRFGTLSASGALSYDDYTVVIQGSKNGASYPVISMRRFIEMLRENPVIQVPNDGVVLHQSSATPTTIWQDVFGFTVFSDTFSEFQRDSLWKIDIARVLAYQIVCAHFYTNDHVDYIYSAQMYREMQSFYVTISQPEAADQSTFVYNGMKLPYDWLSGHYIDSMLGSNGNPHAVLYLANIFAFRKSLRFVDYFTGSRTRPLAIGDVNVATTGDKVNIVDITKNVQMQKFLNSVNRAGRKIDEYIEGLFGIKPKKDYHNPYFIGHTADVVVGVENENTGSEQYDRESSVTSVYRGRGNNFVFDFENDRPSIIIGVCYFDIPRAYLSTIDRCFMHLDRFDMFNPYLQFIGDQPVSSYEIGLNGSEHEFAFQLRHMEYKQKNNIAYGGFAEHLPSWTYTYDINNNDLGTPGRLSPEFIRSSNVELDKFYLSLTGWSLASYFHFIVEIDNYIDASRPMAYAPSIL